MFGHTQDNVLVVAWGGMRTFAVSVELKDPVTTPVATNVFVMVPA
jgi:hypothetical protein